MSSDQPSWPILCLAANTDTSIDGKATTVCYLPLGHEEAHRYE